MVSNKQGVMHYSVLDFFEFLLGKKTKKVTLVIPAYNEEPRIKKVIKEAQKVNEITQILVVDDGSRDKTSKVAKSLGVEVIKHHKNLGKGEAIKTGIAHAKGEVILFLDADLMNIDKKKIRGLILPILKDRADFVKASFLLKRGRVTEFAIKPMMKILYPESKFKQPISGQFAGKKEFLETLKIEPEWGIDISILLDAIKHGQRVVEVNLGELKHKGRVPEEKAQMSKDVMETMLKKIGYICGDHSMIIFSDETLFSKIFKNKVGRYLEILNSKKIKIVLITKKEVAPEFKEYFDEIKKINGDNSSKEILKISKKLLKKYCLDFKQLVVVANKSNFENLTKKAELSYCFKRSPKNILENCEVISSLAEILMYLK